MVLTIDPIDPNLTLSGTSNPSTRPDDPGPGLPKHSEFLAQGRSSKAPRRYLHPPEMFQPTGTIRNGQWVDPSMKKTEENQGLVGGWTNPFEKY